MYIARAGHGDALGLDARAAEVDLLHDLRVVVAELRTHHGEAVAGRRARRVDDRGSSTPASTAPVPRPGYVGVVAGPTAVEPSAERRAVAGGRGAAARAWRGSSETIEPSSIVDRPGDRAAGERPVVERLRDRRRRLGVVEEHGVVPRLAARVGAELVLQLGEELGVRRLGAAAGAEDRADERGHRDDVVDGGRRLRRCRAPAK